MRFAVKLLLLGFATLLAAHADPTTLKVYPEKTRQTIQGMGCGAIYYEGHITSFAARNNEKLQRQLYDDLFSEVRTDFLQLMIRPDHEPQNDNDDPYLPKFKPEWFDYCKNNIAICEEAKKRQPQMKIYATLYTPPAWMKTNNDAGGGGKERATIKPGVELELAEYCWAFLAWMQRNGQPVRFLSIANEPDWGHTQPGYCLTAESHAELFATVARYLDEMERRHPEVPKPILVGPNVLSARSAADHWIAPLMRETPNALGVVGSHDYDQRGDRLERLVKAAGGKPVWVTEWCVNREDRSPELLYSATKYWLAMTEAFNSGVHAWMAYDWAYPPRQGGEALIHIDWGNAYTRTKIYYGFKQWCSGLVPGMKNVAIELSGPCASDIGKPGAKAAAFVSADGRKLVVHVAAFQDQSCDFQIEVPQAFAGRPVKRLRTSADENAATLPDLMFKDGTLTDPLPLRSMTTYVIEK